ncbi:type II secretion system F family protein [Mycolicibacterium smegmatis]|jgi:pilus assembly protein TadC|uniref:Bacterial type II secretion system protein F domain n=1 Tax=Mycolicibacterium smegmatis (strain MKD8) TaxID=1214915 RepID=A0A2U9PYT0_MYCSE|nr:type II secretion system F family protein [Mycolicibacterium smegmatis]AWT56981.1 bacterial type II secretion system protein F domain [Mycolicibacterium smegmatis MKD8]
MTWAALCLAGALLIAPARARARALRTTTPRRERAASGTDDPLAAASTFDLFAACLTAGMAVSTAAAAAAQTAPTPLAQALIRASDLLALGADPMTAWSSGVETQDKNVEALLRMARRSAASGTALAHGVSELAAQSRHDVAAAADAAAERAGVLVAGPLGLCYLPAFVCLGIVPVVVGLAGDVLGAGLL